MALRSVRAGQGVPSSKIWENCNDTVGGEIAKADWRQNAIPKLVDLANGGVKVLMYNKDLDFVCNWVGGEKTINGLEWVGQSEWQNIGFQNIGYGLKRELASLAFIKFSNAGHMVPMDQPENALKMVNWFIEEWSPDAL
jgi:carboxypeptidase C (cathepsin A)